MRADVFAAAAFEHQAHVDLVPAMLVKMQGGGAGTDIRAVVDSGERVHRILSQVTELCRLFHGQAGGVLERDLVQPHRDIHVKQYAAGVLADGLGFLPGDGDIALDDFHGALGNGPLFLAFQRLKDRPLHVVGDFGGSAADQLDQRLLKGVHTFQP